MVIVEMEYSNEFSVPILTNGVIFLSDEIKKIKSKMYFKKTYDKELKEIINDDKRPVFVAESDDGVIGYAFCIHRQILNDTSLTDVRTLYIDDLCVDEIARGKHIGKSLYDYVKDYAKKIGCYNLTLNVWECNGSAKAFYEKMGLKTQKTMLETIL